MGSATAAFASEGKSVPTRPTSRLHRYQERKSLTNIYGAPENPKEARTVVLIKIMESVDTTVTLLRPMSREEEPGEKVPGYMLLGNKLVRAYEHGSVSVEYSGAL